MDREELKSRLTWVLVVTNAIAGVTFLLAAFGVVTGEGESHIFYLAAGVVCLVASGAWLLNLGSS
ncbi:MAG: hypothetical protein ACOC7N_03730 [Chloroflexota bacterium]